MSTGVRWPNRTKPRINWNNRQLAKTEADIKIISWGASSAAPPFFRGGGHSPPVWDSTGTAPVSLPDNLSAERPGDKGVVAPRPERNPNPARLTLSNYRFGLEIWRVEKPRFLGGLNVRVQGSATRGRYRERVVFLVFQVVLIRRIGVGVWTYTFWGYLFLRGRGRRF